MNFRKRSLKIFKSIIICLIILMVIYLVSTIIVYATTETQPIVCSDENLYNKLVETIPKDYILSKDIDTKTINIKEDQISKITSLTLSGAEIKNIEGIQILSYLTSLDISDNNITNISPLNSLSNLQKLNISSNSIANITPISILSKLTVLDASSNRISDISAISNLTNLENLNLSLNSISNVSIINKLTKVKYLNLAHNTSITNIDDTLQSSLVSLNLSGTGIKKIKQNDSDENAKITQTCGSLEELYLSDTNISDISYLFDTKYENDETVPYLKLLKKFDYSNPLGSTIDLSSLTIFKELVEIDLPGNSIYSISPIYDMENLQKLNLANNNISDLSGLIEKQYDDQGREYVSKYSKIQNLILERNNISDISDLSNLVNLKQLNLKSNQIYNIEPLENLQLDTLYLQKQKVTMDVYRKQNVENQYIILLNLFQSIRNPSSVIYDTDANFEFNGVTQNTTKKEYEQFPYYNVIIPIEYENYEERNLYVKINGGIADESELDFNISDSSSATDSLLFEDQKLDAAIYEYLSKNLQEGTYMARAPLIMNIEKQQVFNASELDLSNHDISNIKGLSNFSYLNSLNLSDNSISDISEIEYLNSLNSLYLSNNKLNGNYDAIEGLYYINNLALSGNSISSLESFNKLIQNIKEQNYQVELQTLILSNNNIEDISILNEISTLENVDISGNSIDDISYLKNNVNMKTLNISNNNIADISVIKNFSNLNTFNASKNKIKDISVIKNVSLTELNLASNSIENISVISTQTMLKNLDVSSNKISDIKSIENVSITKYNFKQQKLTHNLVGEEDIEIIDLPNIFKQSKTQSSKIYSSEDFEVENCTISEDGQKVIVNKKELNGGSAKVIIKGGKADGTTFNLAEAVKGTITYSTEEKTNQDVVATISFNKSDVTITNNDGKNTYTFTENGSFTFYYIDNSSEIDGSSTATVNWIDKTPPEVILESAKYVINKEEGNILNIEPKTIFSIFKSNITNNEDDYKIVDKDDVEKNSESDKIATGDKLITTDGKEFVLGVTGDVNGDGTSDIKDIFAINKHRLNTAALSGIYSSVADVNSDGKVDIKDIFKINKYRLGTITSLNNEEEN